MSEQQLLMSWDGEEFKPFRDLITGQLSIGASVKGIGDSVSKISSHDFAEIGTKTRRGVCSDQENQILLE